MDTFEIVLFTVSFICASFLFYDVRLFMWWIDDITAMCDHDEALALHRSHEGDIRRRPLGSVYLKIKGLF